MTLKCIMYLKRGDSMLHIERKLKTRNIYLNKLIAFLDKEPVKVITGIRRCGKSSLLKLMQEYLLDLGIEQNQIIAINFESLKFQEMNYKELYEYVQKKILNTKRAYLFFDELQKIDGRMLSIHSVLILIVTYILPGLTHIYCHRNTLHIYQEDT